MKNTKLKELLALVFIYLLFICPIVATSSLESERPGASDPYHGDDIDKASTKADGNRDLVNGDLLKELHEDLNGAIKNRGSIKAIDSSVVKMPQRNPGQTATLLPDGRWLMIGGEEKNTVVATISVADKNDGKGEGKVVSLAAKLAVARAWHSATMIPDGRVLIFGGLGADGEIVTSPEVYDPVSQTTEAISVADIDPRFGHTATVMTNGNILFAGGQEANGESLGKAEFWNPDTGIGLDSGAVLQTPRLKHSAALLPSGDVLVWGGFDTNGVELFDGERYSLDEKKFVAEGMITSQQDPAPPYLAASLPRESDQGVSRDTRVALRFSKPLRPETANVTNFVLTNFRGTVQTKVIPVENGMLVFITPSESLESGTVYTLTLNGAKDSANFAIPSTTINFTTRARSGGVHDHGGIKPVGQDNSPVPIDAHDEMQPQDFTPNKGAPDAEEWIPDLKNLNPWRSKKPFSEKNPPLPLLAAKGVTALSGRVLTLDGKPLANVALRVKGLQVQSDATGRFLLTDVPSGIQSLIINGGKASTPTKQYAMFDTRVDITQGITTVLPFNIWLPVIDTHNITELPDLTSREIVGKTPRVPGLEVYVPAGARLRYPHGRSLRNLTITPIPVDRTPFPLPPGATRDGFAFTLQLHGAKVEDAQGNLMPGLRVVFPNAIGAPAGTRLPLWNYEPKANGWYIYGYGTVTKDKKQVIPDAGTDLQSMHCFVYIGNTESVPQEGSPAGSCVCDGDPVDLNTGLFVYSKTDFIIPDIVPISLTRTYRQRDSLQRDFGTGTSHPYAMFLAGPASGEYFDLVLPDGGRIRYESGVHLATPTEFYGSTLFRSGPNFEIKLLNGLKLKFTAVMIPSTHYFREIKLRSFEDRYGNVVLIQNDRISTQSGRWVQLSRDGTNRIIQASDNIGRTVNYTYDTGGRLWKVTDQAGGVTEYTYDGFGQMLTIKDAHGIVFLTNEYDTNGRVFRQTQADNTTYQFAYILDTNGKVTQTDVTDPRGILRRTTYNSTGYSLTDTSAVGSPEQQTITIERNAGNQPVKITDSLGRKVAYSYNDKGRVESITDLAETAGAVTTTYTYDLTFNKVATVTDPLNHVTTLGYDSNGNATSVTDALNHQFTFGYNTKGQLTSVTDALNNTTQFVYQGGDLVQITDPLNRTVTRGFDEVGRLVRVTNPLGHTTRIQYNAVNRPIRITDRSGRITSTAYDPNGNVTSVTDALGRVTSYTYNNMDRLETRTDPLLKAESYAYDQNGNQTKFTDRRGKVTTYRYDNLNRTIFAGFGTLGEHPTATYESTISYSYDAVDRMVSAADSASGTLNWSYNDAARTISETSPRGTVGYGFDTAGRQASMTVSGQPAVNYTYDNADRLIGISQGSSNVGFGYDNADRRNSLTLPNGVSVEYGYDAASQLTNLTYKLGAATLGDLAYGYDQAGRRNSTGGSFAQVVMPATMSSAATHDAGNRLMQRGSTNFIYDENGNLTSDGTNTYVWNARNQLASINGAVSASFTYDAFGRRTSRNIGGQTTGYLYDGANVVQEQNAASSPTANLLMGGVDEMFSRGDVASGTNYTPITDALGSTMALLNAAGVSTTNYSYEPFGGTTATGSTNGNNSKFTGREEDGGTGLYHFRARYYSPALQRFISEDPMGFAAGDSNFYPYVGNDPLNYKDPSGQIPVDTVADVGFIGYDLYQLATGGRKNLGANAAALGLDVLGLIIPYATGLGMAYRASRAAKRGAGLIDDSANFAQNTFRQTFSDGGKFAGQTVDDVAAQLRSGKLSPADVPIEFYTRNSGQTLISNTRSAQALTQAGIPRELWDGVNVAGDRAALRRLAEQLRRNKLSPNGTPTVKLSGCN